MIGGGFSNPGFVASGVYFFHFFGKDQKHFTFKETFSNFDGLPRLENDARALLHPLRTS